MSFSTVLSPLISTFQDEECALDLDLSIDTFFIDFDKPIGK